MMLLCSRVSDINPVLFFRKQSKLIHERENISMMLSCTKSQENVGSASGENEAVGRFFQQNRGAGKGSRGRCWCPPCVKLGDESDRICNTRTTTEIQNPRSKQNPSPKSDTQSSPQTNPIHNPSPKIRSSPETESQKNQSQVIRAGQEKSRNQNPDTRKYRVRAKRANRLQIRSETEAGDQSSNRLESLLRCWKYKL